MNRLSVINRHILVAAASLGLVACASSSRSTSETPPPDDAPAAANTGDGDAAAHDHHGHDASWFWGEPGKVSHVGEDHCYIYPKLAVLVSSTAVVFDAADKAPGCAMGATAKTIEVGSEQSFRGVAGDRVLIGEEIGSDYYNLMVYDATGARVFMAETVPPQSRTHVDRDKGQLVYGVGIEFSEACRKDLQDYAAQEKACWAEVQKAHPILKDTAAPGCDCGPGGLLPFPILHKSVPLAKPSTAPVDVMPLICGCSS